MRSIPTNTKRQQRVVRGRSLLGIGRSGEPSEEGLTIELLLQELLAALLLILDQRSTERRDVIDLTPYGR